MFKYSLIIAFLLSCSFADRNIEEADLIFHNANIITMCEKTPKAEFVAIKGEKIIAVGSKEQMEKFKGEKTKLVDLGGKTVIPGLIDTHIHLHLDAKRNYKGDSIKEKIINALKFYSSVGLTTIHEPGILSGKKASEIVKLYKSILDDGELRCRLYLMPYPYEIEDDKPFVGDYISMRGTKLRIDYELGTWRALLFEPYSDKPETKGAMHYKPEKLEEEARWAVKNGFQPGAHAIGDRGNRIVLDTYEKVLKENKDKDLRFRIEHAQIIHPDDIARFGKLKIIASMQPIHATSDMKWAENRLGKDRLKGAYPWNSLLKTGAILGFGSDSPVESPNPFWGIHAAVTREDQNGKPKGGWLPDEKITVEQALYAYTLGAAYAAFEENVKGSLEAGKFADLVVISEDILKIKPNDLFKIKVLRTVLGGKTVYQTD